MGRDWVCVDSITPMQYVVFISVDKGKLRLHEWINDKNLKSCSFPSKKTKKKEKSSRIFFDIPLKKKHIPEMQTKPTQVACPQMTSSTWLALMK